MNLTRVTTFQNSYLGCYVLRSLNLSVKVYNFICQLLQASQLLTRDTFSKYVGHFGEIAKTKSYNASPQVASVGNEHT